jgi:hypothetical protein
MAALPFILTAMFLLVAYWQRKAERETKVIERDVTETIYD